jgi:hypothetical protein
LVGLFTCAAAPAALADDASTPLAPVQYVEPVAPLCEEALIACFDRQIAIACWYYFRFCQGGSSASLAISDLTAPTNGACMVGGEPIGPAALPLTPTRS